VGTVPKKLDEGVFCGAAGPVAVLVTFSTPAGVDGGFLAELQFTGRLMAPPPLTVWQLTVPVLLMEAMALPPEQALPTRF